MVCVVTWVSVDVLGGGGGACVSKKIMCGGGVEVSVCRHWGVVVWG